MDQRPALKKIPLILVTGFLGSGKTSLLCNLLKRYSGKWRIAIVQNEFAAGHVDGTTLKQTQSPFELLEINNGSLFCACQLGDFVARLDPFLDQANPDLIILEATGLADPASMGQILHSGNLAQKLYLAAIWCIADAANFLKIINVVNRTKQQIRLADLILINKIDLVQETKSIRQKIADLNPSAPVLETRYGITEGIDLEQMLSDGALLPDRQLSSVSSEGRPPFNTCVIKTNRLFDETATRQFISSQAPKLIRMKGYVRVSPESTLLVQTVFNEINLLIINDYDGPTELIALGTELNRQDFSRQFLALPS